MIRVQVHLQTATRQTANLYKNDYSLSRRHIKQSLFFEMQSRPSGIPDKYDLQAISLDGSSAQFILFRAALATGVCSRSGGFGRIAGIQTPAKLSCRIIRVG
jgi:hypothetical protein